MLCLGKIRFILGINQRKDSRAEIWGVINACPKEFGSRESQICSGWKRLFQGKGNLPPGCAKLDPTLDFFHQERGKDEPILDGFIDYFPNPTWIPSLWFSFFSLLVFDQILNSSFRLERDLWNSLDPASLSKPCKVKWGNAKFRPVYFWISPRMKIPSCSQDKIHTFLLLGTFPASSVCTVFPRSRDFIHTL